MVNFHTKKRWHHHLKHHASRAHHHAHHFLIPHHGNNHRPHALRPPALRIYAVAIIAIKLFVTGFLFLIHPSAGAFATATNAQILASTNASRAEAGVPALAMNATLNQAASLKLQHMLANDYFAHTAPDGTKPWAFFKQAGYSYSTAGENLAMDFADADSVHAAFMNSPSHRKNILNSKYTEIGIAVADGMLQGHQTTALVVFFGTPYQSVAVAPEPEPTPAPVPSTPTVPTTPATPTTPTVTAPPKPAPPPYYQAELADSRETELGVLTNERIKFWINFKNTGNTTWTRDGEYFVALNVTNPAERVSAFADESWIEYYRPAILSESSVAPGQHGRFEFYLQAPEEAGSYEESFGLVAENLTWIDGGSISLPIVVVAPPERVTENEAEVIQTAGITKPAEPTATPPTDASPIPAAPTTDAPAAEPLSGNESTTPAVTLQTVPTAEASPGIVGTIMLSVETFLQVLVIFVIVALLINILVKIRVQHPHVIVQTMLVIILGITALTVNLHFLEAVPQTLKIF